MNRMLLIVCLFSIPTLIGFSAEPPCSLCQEAKDHKMEGEIPPLFVESGIVVGMDGPLTLILDDGRIVGVVGVEVKGLTDAELNRIGKWIEIFTLDRRVEFRDAYKTGFGKIAAAPIWRNKDIIGTLIQMGAVRINPYGLTTQRLERWKGYQSQAQNKQTGLWQKTTIVQQPAVRQVPVRPFPILSNTISALSGGT